MDDRCLFFTKAHLLSIARRPTLWSGCGNEPITESSSYFWTKPKKLKVAVVLDTGGENDKSFNEYTLKGAQEAATANNLDISYVVSA